MDVCECMDGLLDDWMHAWLGECVCGLIVSSSLGLRDIKPRQRPLPIGLRGFTLRQRTSKFTTNKKPMHTLNQPCIHPIIHPSNHPSVHSPTHPFTHPSVHPPIHPPIHHRNPQSTHPSVHPYATAYRASESMVSRQKAE